MTIRPLRILVTAFIALMLIAAVFLAIRASINKIPIVKYGVSSSSAAGTPEASLEPFIRPPLSGRTAHHRNEVYGYAFDYPEDWESYGQPVEGTSISEELPLINRPTDLFPSMIHVRIEMDTTVADLRGHPWYGPITGPVTVGKTAMYATSDPNDADILTYLVPHASNVLVVRMRASDDFARQAIEASIKSFALFPPANLPDAGKDFTAKKEIPFTFSTRGLDAEIFKTEESAEQFVKDHVEYLQGCDATRAEALAEALPALKGKEMHTLVIQGRGVFTGGELRLHWIPNVFGYANVKQAGEAWAGCDAGVEYPLDANARYALFTIGCGGAGVICGAMSEVIHPTFRWK